MRQTSTFAVNYRIVPAHFVSVKVRFVTNFGLSSNNIPFRLRVIYQATGRAGFPANSHATPRRARLATINLVLRPLPRSMPKVSFGDIFKGQPGEVWTKGIALQVELENSATDESGAVLPVKVRGNNLWSECIYALNHAWGNKIQKSWNCNLFQKLKLLYSRNGLWFKDYYILALQSLRTACGPYPPVTGGGRERCVVHVSSIASALEVECSEVYNSLV